MEAKGNLLKRYQNDPDHQEIAEISFRTGKQEGLKEGKKEVKNMEAKDTVMNSAELAQAVMERPDLSMRQAISLKQAEITWKARDAEIVEARNAGKQEGEKIGYEKGRELNEKRHDRHAF